MSSIRCTTPRPAVGLTSTVTRSSARDETGTVKEMVAPWAIRGPCSIFFRYEYSPIHLCDEGPPEGGPAESRDPQGHLAVVLSGRENRCSRPERLGQELAAAHHGGRRHELHWRGVAGQGNAHRLFAAGAPAGSCAERARQR